MSKSHAVLFLQLLLVHNAIQSQMEADCGTDVNLPCLGINGSGEKFISVGWYKIEETKRGIIRWSGKAPRPYDYPREARFGESYSLILPRVTPEDTGRYECAINADVGGQNQYLHIDLRVGKCDARFETTTVASFPNSSLPKSPCPNVQDLPLMWSTVGFVAVALTKIGLSLLSTWVIHKRSSRQRRDR